jgi:GTPase Era involved in 16S rRNA processing
MYFQLNRPSISQIRAKFIIDKLNNFPQNIDSINIFVTGKTHSGKTTLGNRLLGIDYFLSTGRQDCTKEINLIEFPIGLKYFDLPGVCSDDRLENYNRVALELAQVEDFPCIDELTLAKYKESQSPFEQNLSVSDYTSLQFKPDLIYYLIAPDKQFARGDRKYLKDLLKRHQNIIYVFNMFVNKQTGISYSATEANIQDVATQILKIHRNILGENSQPKVVGVNCWTGEGISELLHQSQQILSGEHLTYAMSINTYGDKRK